MSFSAPPTTAEIAATIISQLEASLSQTIPLLPKSFLRVLAKVLAAVFVLIYKYAGFQFLQLFVAHATMDETVVNGKTIQPLVEWGLLIGVGRPLEATRAEHVIQVTVLNQVDDLPGGSQLLRSQTGVIYTTVAAVDLDAPTVPVTMRASSDQFGNGGAGTIGNLQNGDIVSFASPLRNVATDAVVLSQTVAGIDAETVEAYRARIFRRFQRKPQGGAYADYQQWGEEVAGIAHVYPYASDSPGVVDVYVEALTTVENPDGLASEPQCDAVLASINLDSAGKATRRPVTAAVTVRSITREGFDLEVAGLTPNTTANQDAILQGVDEYLRSREPYIVGLSVLPRDDRITRDAVGGIVEGIASARGATVTTVNITPGPAHTLDHGEKAKLGTPSFI